jgi:hypothetical protein
MGYDQHLTARGKRRAAAIEAALTSRSQEPGVVEPIRSNRRVEAAREAARKYALRSAELSLRGAGDEFPPTLDDVRATEAEQRRVVHEVNSRLAEERIAVARRPGGRGEELDAMVRRVLRENAAKASGAKIPDEEPEPGAEEKRRRARHYRHFLNRA